jgi:hypothetical protein
MSVVEPHTHTHTTATHPAPVTTAATTTAPITNEKKSFFSRKKVPHQTQGVPVGVHGANGHGVGLGHGHVHDGMHPQMQEGYATNGPYGRGFKFGSWFK